MTVEWIIISIAIICALAVLVTQERRNGPGPGVE